MGLCKNRGKNNVIPLTGKTGELFSPLFPRDYPHSIMCTWVITVPEGHFVKLRIKSFKLSSICYDLGPTLDIRDGQSSSSNRLKSFCGQRFEPSVFSSGRHLWVRFDIPEDDAIYDYGFYAVFEAVKQRKASVFLYIYWTFTPLLPNFFPSFPQPMLDFLSHRDDLCSGTRLNRRGWHKPLKWF